MDFLDPKQKRAHTIRLFTGYGLMAILIAAATVLVVFGAYGYDINRSTGEIIQNGLVFVDSQPTAADISVDGNMERSRTSARLSLPAGHHTIEIKRSGYKTWQRSIELTGSSIERLSYPLLFPDKLVSQDLQSYSEAPSLFSQSIDRRWLLVAFPSQLGTFFAYDLTSFNLTTKTIASPAAIILSPSIINTSSGVHQMTTVSWASDNRHVLLRHEYPGGVEFIMLDRDSPVDSFNVSKLTPTPPDKVSMLTRRPDQLYVYFSKDKTLQLVETKTKVPTLIESNILDFAIGADNAILYARRLPGVDTVQAFIRAAGQEYVLREIKGDTPLLAVVNYDSATYYTVGSVGEKRVFIYKDPLSVLRKSTGRLPIPVSVLKVDQTPSLSTSPNGRFVVLSDGGKFSLYDAEDKQTFKFELNTPTDGHPIVWLDDFHLEARINDQLRIMDFEGSNQEIVSPSLAHFPALLAPDSSALFTIALAAQAPNNSPTLVRTQLSQ